MELTPLRRLFGRAKYYIRLAEPRQTTPGVVTLYAIAAITGTATLDKALRTEDGDIPLLSRASTIYPPFANASSMFLANAETIELLIFFAAIGSFLLHLIFVLRGRVRPPSGDGYTARLITTIGEARELQDQVVRRFFPSSNLPNLATQAQTHNNERLIGLFDQQNMLVGYCALWPIRKDVAEHILAGEMTDDDLTISDLLPTTRNTEATHIVIVGFAVLPEVRAVNRYAAYRLIRKVQEVLGERYLTTPRRKLHLLAIAYSKEGESLCEKMGMGWDGTTMVRYANDEHRFAWLRTWLQHLNLSKAKEYPVYCRQVNQSDIFRADPLTDY
ncbi:MAG: hypothetical protein V4512_05955 [Pseudomonadota bacterium]